MNAPVRYPTLSFAGSALTSNSHRSAQGKLYNRFVSSYEMFLYDQSIKLLYDTRSQRSSGAVRMNRATLYRRD